jgi:hypothetical protein
MAMSNIDFPIAPVDNQTFEAANGVVYKYRTAPGNIGWICVTAGTVAGAVWKPYGAIGA